MCSLTKINIYYYIIFICLFINIDFYPRSIHRPIDPLTPKLITHWKNKKKTYQLVDRNLKVTPLLHTFDKDHFIKNMIPDGEISYRHDSYKKISGQKLGKLAQNLLVEIKDGKTKNSNE